MKINKNEKLIETKSLLRKFLKYWLVSPVGRLQVSLSYDLMRNTGKQEY